MRWFQDVLKDNVAVLIATFVSLVVSWANLNNQIGDLNKQVEQMQAYNNKDYGNIKDVQNDVNLLKQEFAQQQAYIDSLRRDSEKTNSNLDKLTDSINRLTAVVSALEVKAEIKK
jgi:chromosome segregation ATPase